jgi:GntR family transcriptional regulator, arabinose operon transcriptional repressor
MNYIFDKSGNMQQVLSNEIIGGVYRAGEKLPGERKLCELYKVSRTTARAVLQEFESNGIIARKARSGAFVSSNAVEIIENLHCEPVLRVVYIMPCEQQSNPLIETVFKTFGQYSDCQIRASVLFQDNIVADHELYRDIDAAVVFALNDEKQLKWLKKHVGRVILLNRKHSEYSYITPDNFAGGKLIGEFLIKSGHEVIGCPHYTIISPDTDYSRRLQGLQQVFEEAGKSLLHHEIPRLRFTEFKAYEEAVNALINSSPSPSALACLADPIAIHIYSVLHHLNISIPKDISVIGFDDRYYAQFTLPPLTTIKYPAEEMGIRLAGALNEYLENGNGEIQETITPTLIKRKSVKLLT